MKNENISKFSHAKCFFCKDEAYFGYYHANTTFIPLCFDCWLFLETKIGDKNRKLSEVRLLNAN